MAVRIAINEPRLLGNLVNALAAGDCAVRPLSDRAVEVSSIAAEDAGECRSELVFFLRAWANANPAVDVLFL
jgi:hypothetical protein